MSSDLTPLSGNAPEQQVLSSNDDSALQAKLWVLLRERAARYTAGESSSIPNETAQELLSSLCFTLGIDESQNATERKRLSESDLAEEFALGLRRIERKIALANSLWQAALRSLTPIENRSLYDTLRSIQSFSKRYNYIYFAHQIPCEIDYQLCHPVSESLLGIDYLTEYLRHLLIENDLLQRFDLHLVIRLLEQSCPDYRGLLINLYEPVAVNALGLSLLGQNAQPLTVSAAQRQQLFALLAAMPRAQTQQVLLSAAKRLGDALGIDREPARRYLEELAVNLYPRIKLALSGGGLEGIFLSF